MGKGLSLDEKRDKLLELFHDTRDVFVLKDVEKLGAKKGVVQQSIKEVLQGLVDDDLVHQERIGASNFFWAFRSEIGVKLENDRAKQEALLQQLQGQRAELEQRTADAQVGREDSEERTQLLGEVAELEKALAVHRQQLAQYAANDPEKFEAMRNAVDVARDAANRWLDNLHALRMWAKRRFEGMEGQLDSFFEQTGMTDAMDYLE